MESIKTPLITFLLIHVNFITCDINCLPTVRIFLGSEALHDAEFGEGSGVILLEGLECVGTEDSLLDCDMDVELGLTLCDHSHDAGIHCFGNYVYK